MPKISKEEKLEKINEQIQNENETIKKSKQKIKKLNLKKKKLEQQIANEEYAELKDVLKDYGITSVGDFQNFIDSCTDKEKSETDNNTTSGYENANSNFQ